MTRTFASADWARHVPTGFGLTFIAVAAIAACAWPLATTPIPMTPIPIGEPTPGSFHVRGSPPTALEPLTIRVDNGTPSRWSEEVPAGAPVWVFFTTLPEAGLALWVNGVTCEGRFDVRPMVETDLALHMTASGCEIQLLGFHAEGAIEHGPPPTSDSAFATSTAT